MPLQNRVTPFGEIVATPERGTMMGNRGILHDGGQRVRRRWAGRAWICCLLEFRGRRDPVMAPGHYTRLFFLDEPTALAAGHRPCAFCRRADYRAFQAAWAVGSAQPNLGSKPRAAEMDRVLHAERVGPGGTKRLHPAPIDTLPDGVFVTLEVGEAGDHGAAIVRAADPSGARTTRDGSERDGREAYLLWRGALWRWTPGGYSEAGPVQFRSVLTLTPPSIVEVLRSGYRPGPPAGLA